MNEIARRDRYADEIARARDIVARHVLPDFITGFDIRLTLSHFGEPAVVVAFETNGNGRDLPRDELFRRAEEYRKVDRAVLDELLDAFEDRLPFSVLVSDEQ